MMAYCRQARDHSRTCTGRPIISRIKIMAQLDIAERRLPQDGQSKNRGPRQGTIDLRDLDAADRCMASRSSCGSSTATASHLIFDALGIVEPGARAAAMRSSISRTGSSWSPGPTGSGKTTTLYAALCAINSEARKVLTVEDPVEYQLDGVNQVQVQAGDRAELSPTSCAQCCVRIRTSSWSAKSATERLRASRPRPH